MEFFNIFYAFREIKSSKDNSDISEEQSLVLLYKNFSKNRLMNLEGETKRIESLEEQINILKNEVKTKEKHYDHVLTEINQLKKKFDLIENTAKDYQTNTEIGHHHELENNVVTLEILRVTIT